MKLKSIDEYVSVLGDNGYMVAKESDSSFVLSVEPVKRSYGVQAQLADNFLLITCSLGLVSNYADKASLSAFMTASLSQNFIMNPYALAILGGEEADTDEDAALTSTLVLLDKIPVADLDESEVISSIESLVHAVMIFESNIVSAFDSDYDAGSDDDDDDDDDFDIEDLLILDVFDVPIAYTDESLLQEVEEEEQKAPEPESVVEPEPVMSVSDSSPSYESSYDSSSSDSSDSGSSDSGSDD